MGCTRIVLAVALQRYVDFTPVALRGREVAVALARVRGAPLDVLTVEAPVALLPAAESTGEKLERFVAPIREEGLAAEAHLLRGRPSEQIRDFLAGAAAGLLIIGSHSKRGPLDIGLGGTASALANDSPCPVLMIWPTGEETERTRELMIPGYPFIFPYG